MSIKPAQGRATAPEQLTPLELFSRQLAERFPKRVVKRFAMPASVPEAREIFMLELNSRDERDAAIFTDAIVTAIERSSYKLIMEAEKREQIRLSIVGLGELVAGEIAYRHTNTDPAIPLAEITDWSSRAWVPLHRYFSEVNGVPNDEIDEGIKGAQIVGAFYAPKKQETPASAAIGRSDASSGANT